MNVQFSPGRPGINTYIIIRKIDMPTTTAVFRFLPGEEIGHAPEQDGLIDTIPGAALDTLPFFAANGLTVTNKISDTIDVETSTRTVVREWASNELATEFVTALQTAYIEPGNSGQLVSVQVNP